MMQKLNKKFILEFSSLTLVLSYFFLHKIILVLSGITLSIYMINIEFIKNLIITINKSFLNEKSAKDQRRENNLVELEFVDTESTKDDYNLTLVEKIEELGYIPTVEKNDNSDVA